MNVSAITVSEYGEACRLRANVQLQTHWVWGDKPFPLEYRFPREFAGSLGDAGGDPFLAALLPIAMALGESLEVEAPVSAVLHRRLRPLQQIYTCFDPKLSCVTVNAPVRSSRYASRGPNRGLFFSMGVDSSYCLAKNAELPSDDEEAITHLIPVLGFDVYLWDEGTYPPILDAIGRAAGAFGKQVLPVSTNTRDLSDRVVHWQWVYHGAALASIGLALGRDFSSVMIAASATYHVLFPLGSHPCLDQSWSNDRVSFCHDGLEQSRLGRLRFLAQYPALFQDLRVCVTDGSARNCGSCPKCLWTSLCMCAAGVLPLAKEMPQVITPEMVRQIPIKSDGRARQMASTRTEAPLPINVPLPTLPSITQL